MREKRTSTRLIINATNIGRRLSGIGIYTLSLLQELARQDHDRQYTVYLNRSARPHLQDIHFPDNFRLKWVSKQLSPDDGFIGHFLRLLFANLLALFHWRHWIFNTSQLEACFFRARQIITIHDVIPLLFREYHLKQYPYFKYLLKFALRRARRIITPSGHSQLLLQEIYGLSGDKIRVIPNGVQEIYHHAYQPSYRRRGGYILYSGRICPMKNVTTLIQAFALIRDRIPHKLILAGEGRESLDEAVRQGILSAEDLADARIELRGHVSNREMRTLMQHASLFVFPSLYEGFGLPPLEAMACGCPVIVSHAASLPEVCGEAVFYADPHNPLELALEIYQVLSDPATQERLSRAGRQRSYCFSWRKSAAAHLAAFRQTIEGQPVVPETRPLSPKNHLQTNTAVFLPKDAI